MDFLREAELKHCRMAMLGYLGFVAVDLGITVYPAAPGLEGLSSVQAHDAAVEQGGLGQILLWVSLAESISSIAVVQMLQGSGRKPGEFGFDPLGFCKNKSAEEVRTMEKKELTNGRLAMLAFSGVVTQAVLTQGPFPYV
jgi:light-harvesting complex I chlorophyll a/b binding protein 1